jgi:DNA mismatch repair ATPase MutS
MNENILKRFYELKSRYPDVIILFCTGDFYEAYQEDAEEASKILGITLTKSSTRKNKDDKPLMLTGFPFHALDIYLPKLIRAGKRVAICDQLEDPYTKKVVKRCISELVSNN